VGAWVKRRSIKEAAAEAIEAWRPKSIANLGEGNFMESKNTYIYYLGCAWEALGDGNKPEKTLKASTGWASLPAGKARGLPLL
jgi:hypothetical protein